MKPPIDIPGLGEVTFEDVWYTSSPIAVRALGGIMCEIKVNGYVEDPHKEDFHTAIANFLSIGPEVLREVEEHVFQYYKDIKAEREEEDEDDGDDDDEEEEDDDDDDAVVDIQSPADVWRHVQLSKRPVIERRSYGDRGIYVSLECGCDWEEEHGLQIVLKNGLRVNKVGSYDGHVTNSDAWADDSLEDVIYRR